METQELIASLALAQEAAVTYTDIDQAQDMLQINWDTRAVTIPKSITNAGVINDHLSKKLVFCMDRYVCGVDLAEHTFAIHFINVDTWDNKKKKYDECASGVYPVTNIDLSVDGKVTCEWEITNAATQIVGDVVFALHVFTIVDNAFTYHLGTTPTVLDLLNTVNATEHGKNITPDEIEVYIQKMADLSAEIDAKVAAAEAAAERAEAAAANFEVDDTLSQSGKAADAAVVGEKFSQLSGEIDNLNKREIIDNNNILNNKNDIIDIQKIIDRLTELKEVVLTDENEETILTEQGELITVLVRYIKTDSTLLNEFLPANSKAVGDKIEYEVNRIRAETIIDYSQFGLPTLYLNGDTTGMTKDNKKTLSYKFNDVNGICSCKWQGNSSTRYPKKNYSITFDKPFCVKDEWGEQAKYCFKANWIDFSHSRNIVSASLWGDIVRDRHSYITDILTENGENLKEENGNNITSLKGDSIFYLPNGGAVDGFPCVIYLNGKFHGLYSWNVPKDKWMLGMGKSTTEYIVTAENNNSLATSFKSTALVDGSDFDIEYCDKSANKNDVIASLNTMIQAVINCDSESKYNELKNYLDIDSAIDYVIFTSLIAAPDCVSHNYILATYDGVKWFFVAYDLDTVFGNYFDGTKYYKCDIEPTITNYWNKVANVIKRFDKTNLVERYNYLIGDILSLDCVQNRFLNYMVGIPCSAKQADANLYKTLPGTETSNIGQIFSYYQNRLPVITKQINEL